MSSIWKKFHNLEDIYWMPSTMSEKNPYPDLSQWKCRTQGVKKIMKSSERYIKQRIYSFHIADIKSFIRY